MFLNEIYKHIIMIQISQILNYTKKSLCIFILCIMAWQQWSTFLKHEKKFLNPLKFINENYGNDYISQNEKRYIEIKKIFRFPAHLCYLGEANDNFAFWSANYSISQYYLSPNILIKDRIDCDTILYNLYRSIHIDPATNFHLNNGWHVVKDFNNGLILLAK